VDGKRKQSYTIRGTGRFATSRAQGSEAEQTNRGHAEAAACRLGTVEDYLANGTTTGAESALIVTRRFGAQPCSFLQGEDRGDSPDHPPLQREARESLISRKTVAEVPGANGVVELTPFEFLDRLAALVPPPRKHRHRYHGVFAPNHKLRRAVTALAVGNVGQQREATAGGYASDDHATGGCCDANHVTLKPRSHDTSRIAWVKLMARVGQAFPLACPNCSGDIRLIAFITEPGPIRKILTHLGEPLDPPPVSPARGPPTDWGELVQADEDREAVQGSPHELPVIDIHSL